MFKYEFYKQINQDINTKFISKKFIKPKYLRLTEEYYEKLGCLSTERQTEPKVHFDEYYYEGETYHSEDYSRYTNGEDSPTYMIYLNAKEFKGEFMREILKIYHELNIYKKHEMQVHPESEQFTMYYNFF